VVKRRAAAREEFAQPIGIIDAAALGRKHQSWLKAAYFPLGRCHGGRHAETWIGYFERDERALS
jgi:hypothetical protein